MKFNRNILFAIALSIVGTIYGYYGGLMNENPYYAPVYFTQSPDASAWSWKPSKCWMTSYILCYSEVGVRNTRLGFMFLTHEARNKFLAISSLMGLGLGLLISVVILLIKRATDVAKPESS